jgi:hypothetical protein
MKATPVRWWDADKEGMKDRSQCQRIMNVRFGIELENIVKKYKGINHLAGHVEQCKTIWSSTPKEVLTHIFLHTMDIIMKNRYLEMEMCIETTSWDELVQRFKVTFNFEHKYPLIDAALQVIRTKIFSEEELIEVVPICSVHRASMIFHELLECYNVTKEEQGEEDTRNVQVPETEGKCVVEGIDLESVAYTQPINMRKVNIGTTENTKFAQIGDYWSDENVEKIAYLLCEYQDLFPTTFSKMKGIVGELCEMKIPLKPSAKPM